MTGCRRSLESASLPAVTFGAGPEAAAMCPNIEIPQGLDAT